MINDAMSQIKDELARIDNLHKPQKLENSTITVSGCPHTEALIKALSVAVTELAKANKKLDEIAETLDHQNMSVNGWHLNGDTERLDNFFESSDWYSDDEAITTIANILSGGKDGK